MDLVNRTVLHKIFGEGTICERNKNIVSVRFGSAIKKFVFPDAFRNYLILTDKESQQYVNGVLDKKDKEMRLKRERDIREAEKRKMLENLPVHSKSQAAFGFIENDKQEVLENWTVFAGNYRSGYNRGKPRTPSRVYPNSACLLTYCGEKELEENRSIWGVFMAKEDFVGPECSDGIISAHDEYRIILHEDERKNFLFWRYYNRESENQNTKWGSVEVKYFSNFTMACILNDILSIKHYTEQQPLCEEFLNYFCKLNKISKKQLSGFNEEQAVNQ